MTDHSLWRGRVQSGAATLAVRYAQYAHQVPGHVGACHAPRFVGMHQVPGGKALLKL